MRRLLPTCLLLPTLLLAACDDTGGSDTGEGPNLVVSGFYIEDRGSSYDFVVIVENVGTLPADTFSVDLFLDRSSEPREGQTGDDRLKVLDGLDVDGLDTVTFTVASGAIGTGQTAWVYVDSTGEVPETSEDDNAASTDVTSRRR